MRKIANPEQLDAELRALLDANRTGATREDLAASLQSLADRVATKRTVEQWLPWIDKNLSDRGADFKESASHFAREARDTLPPKALQLAEQLKKLTKEADEVIGRLIISLG